MAEIKIKKKTPIWPWILGILAILLIVFFLIFTNNDNDDDDVSDDTTEMVTDDVNNGESEDVMTLSSDANSQVEAYTTFIAKDPEMGLEHEYSHNALDKLIDATEAVATSLNVDIAADLNTARSNAGSITDDPLKVEHADKIKNAANIITQALGKIQTQKFPDMGNSLTELQDTVASIAPGTQTLEQKTAVKNFFNKAGEVLTNMKNN